MELTNIHIYMYIQTLAHFHLMTHASQKTKSEIINIKNQYRI